MCNIKDVYNSNAFAEPDIRSKRSCLRISPVPSRTDVSNDARKIKKYDSQQITSLPVCTCDDDDAVTCKVRAAALVLDTNGSNSPLWPPLRVVENDNNRRSRPEIETNYCWRIRFPALPVIGKRLRFAVTPVRRRSRVQSRTDEIRLTRTRGQRLKCTIRRLIIPPTAKLLSVQKMHRVLSRPWLFFSA